MDISCGKVVVFLLFQGTEHPHAASSKKVIPSSVGITHPQTEVLKRSVVDSRFSFTAFFVQVQTVFTASLKQGACRKSKPLLCFLQSIKQYPQQTSSALPA